MCVFLCRYMYTGRMSAPTEDLITLIAASDFYMLTVLKTSLDEEIAGCVELSNVLNLSEFAADYRLPVLADRCDRMIITKFPLVVQEEDFFLMSEKEVTAFFQKCKPYAVQLGYDNMLQAAAAWAEKNKESINQCEASLQCTMEKYAQKILGFAPPREKLLLAYMTGKHISVVGSNGQLHKLADRPAATLQYSGEHHSSLRSYRSEIFRMDNGILEVVSAYHEDFDFPLLIEILTRKAPSFEGKTVYLFDGTAEAIFYKLIYPHHNTLVIFPPGNCFTCGDHYTCYDFESQSLSEIYFDVRKGFYYFLTEKVASFGKDLYIRTNDYGIFALRGDAFREIPVYHERGTSTDFFIDLATVRRTNFATVHVWLYMYVTEDVKSEEERAKLKWLNMFKSDTEPELELYTNDEDSESVRTSVRTQVKVHCYNMESGVWTKLEPEMDAEFTSVDEACAHGNTVYLKDESGKLFEHDLLTDVVRASERPTPDRNITLLPLIVDSEHLGPV